MSRPVGMPADGARILGAGLDSAIGDAAQDALREAGLGATVITVTGEGPMPLSDASCHV